MKAKRWLADTLESFAASWAEGQPFTTEAAAILDSCESVMDIEADSQYDYAETIGRALSRWANGEPCDDTGLRRCIEALKKN